MYLSGRSFLVQEREARCLTKDQIAGADCEGNWAMDADLELLQLQCNEQSDGSDGCNPYLWVVLLRIDDDTLGSNPPVAAVYPVDPGAARLVVKAAMKAGDTAVVPDQVAHLAAHIRTDSVERTLILIAALLDQHGTPGAAMAAGWTAFVNAAPTEVGAQLLPLQDPGQKAQAIQTIEAQIKSKVQSAIEGQLSWWDDVEIGLHLETPDRVIATAYQDWEGVASASADSFTLEFAAGSDDFALGGQLLVNVDPCEAQAAAVQEIQDAIATIEGRVKELNSGQVHEPPAKIEAELEQLGTDMLQERSKLAAAELALNTCRARTVPPAGPGPVESELKA
jgi:hypothetical protein